MATKKAAAEVFRPVFRHGLWTDAQETLVYIAAVKQSTMTAEEIAAVLEQIPKHHTGPHGALATHMREALEAEWMRRYKR